MVYLQSDYIITPLGKGIDANLTAIYQGKSNLKCHNSVHREDLVIPAMASLLDETQYRMDGYTFFECLCIRAVEGALQGKTIDKDAIFILSSTKGDIWCSMAETATHIATYFGNQNSPIVVSTACTSGVSAQIVAQRVIESGQYDTAIVIGTDIQREFIISGFQCFHALSDTPCKPFDKNRDGLNVGEAVACMVLGKTPLGLGWTLMGGSIHNDANHISGPSRTAEGSFRCLQDLLPLVNKNDLACISMHGTGTPYNDEMESIALHRAQVETIPISALKGYYGHTMGAAGLLETILCLHATANGYVLPIKGFQQQGTTFAVNASPLLRTTTKKCIIKLLSGFGGVNAAVAWTINTQINQQKRPKSKWKVEERIQIDSTTNLTETYKQLIGDYPKFYKMDKLCQLGLIGVESLFLKMKEKQPDWHWDSEKTAIVLANQSASIKNDTEYQATIKDKSNYFPSPALFVYTLPNIVTGEIAIRYKILGETICYIQTNSTIWNKNKRMLLTNYRAEQVIIGWVECKSETEYNANIELLTKE